MTSNNEVVLIAGDFNIGAGKKKSGGSQTKVFEDTRETMKILYVARNHRLIYTYIHDHIGKT